LSWSSRVSASRFAKGMDSVMNYVKEAATLFGEAGGNWRFTPGETPFSSTWIPVTTVLSYFVLIHLLQNKMELKKPFQMRGVLIAHNAFLCLASLVLFIWLFGTIVYRTFDQDATPHYLLCSEKMHNNGSLHIIYWLNNLTKYWELLDTVFLVLRKKPVLFLHEYHHGATLLLTWSQQREHSTVQWVPILLNLGVHIVMYYYYTLSAAKIHVWWKKYLTTLQIVQFVVGVGACSYCYGKYLLNGFDYSLCYGTDTGAVTGIAILVSYLLLFIRFYFQTYSAKGSKQKVN